MSYAHTANSETTSINSDLKPESTISYEAGLEMSFLNNRLGFEATVYSSETKNLTFPIKGTYIQYIANSGVMSNKGFELSLHGIGNSSY